MSAGESKKVWLSALNTTKRGKGLKGFSALVFSSQETS